MVNPSRLWEGYIRGVRGGRGRILFDLGVVSGSTESISVRSIIALCNDEGLKGIRTLDRV